MEYRSLRSTRGGRFFAQLALAVALTLVALPIASPRASWAQSRGGDSVPDLEAIEKAFIRLAEHVRPSVVVVQTYLTRIVDRETRLRVRFPSSKGTGLIVDGDGLILTNQHVIQGAEAIQVILHDQRTFDATVVSSDPRIDLAVLRIDAEHLRAVTWGDGDSVKVGQWAFACGNPLGLASRTGRASLTHGIVNGLGRDITRRIVEPDAEFEMRYYGNLIETTASVHPGSSGGPLFNIKGQVIGIVTAVELSSHLEATRGFAIPININTRRIIDTLMSGGVVRYGFLGVEVKDVASNRLRFVRGQGSRGARIDRIVLPEGPAALAGLEAADVVIEFDGVPVEDSDHLVRLVGFTAVGTEAKIVFLRNRVRYETVVKLIDRFNTSSRATDPQEQPDY